MFSVHDYVVGPGLAHQVQGHGIDIAVVRGNGRKPPGLLVEDPAEEGHRREHVGFVDAGNPPRPAAFFSPLSQPQGKVEHPLRALAGEFHRVPRLLVAADLPAAPRVKEPFCLLADETS